MHLKQCSKLLSHYRFKVLSFGLTNALITFQGVMNQAFHKFNGKFVLVYLDNVLIFSKSEEEHVEYLSLNKCN